MNLPNQLTLLRLVLTAVFVVLLSVDIPGLFAWKYSLGFVVFVVAAFTDFLDGYLARKHQLITNFGKLMDPLADKVLTAAGFVVLVENQQIQAWAVIAILAREFLVTGLRLVASSQGKVVSADRLGKQKTIWQIITLIYFLLFLATVEPAFSWASWIYAWKIAGIESRIIIGPILIYISLILTAWSGVGYAVKNWHLLREE